MTGDAKFWNYSPQEKESKENGYLLYYGPSANVSLDIEVIEEDKESRATMRTVGKVATAIGVIGETAPPPYNLAGTALGVVGAGVTFASNLVDDDLEFRLLTMISKDTFGLYKFERAAGHMRVWIRKSLMLFSKPVETKKVTVRISEIRIPDQWIPEIEGIEYCCGGACHGSCWDCCLSWITCRCSRFRSNIEMMATFEKQVLDPFKVKSRNGKAILANTMGVFNVLVFEGQHDINSPIAFSIALHNGYDPVSDQEFQDAEALLQKASTLQKAVMTEIDRQKQARLVEIQADLQKKEKKVKSKISKLSEPTIPGPVDPVATAALENRKIIMEARLTKVQAKLAESGAAVDSFKPAMSNPNRFKFEEIIPAALPNIKSLINEFIPERKSFVNYSGLMHITSTEVANGVARRYLTFERVFPGTNGSEQQLLPSPPDGAFNGGTIEFEIKIEDPDEPAPEQILKEIRTIHQQLDTFLAAH